MTDITDQDRRNARQWAEGISSSRILNENARAAVRYVLATVDAPAPTPAEQLANSTRYWQTQIAATITAALDNLAATITAAPDTIATAETPDPADVQPGEAWLVQVDREKRTAVKDTDAGIPWNTVNHSGVFHAENDDDVTLLTRLVPAHRTITDPHDLERLRARSIVLDGTGHACTKNSPGFFSRSDFSLTMITTEQCLAHGPVTVLWEPGA